MSKILTGLLMLASLFMATLSFASKVYFTPEEHYWIAEHRDIPYDFIPSWPLDYMENGQHIGLSRDYLEKIREVTGLNFILSEKKDRPPMLLSSLAPELLSIEQKKGWLFSNRWLSTGALVITPNNTGIINTLDQLYGKRIAVRRGTTYESWLREHAPEVVLLPMDHMREVFQAVYDGQADVGVGSELVMRPLLWRYYSHKLAIAGQIPELMAGFTMGIAAEEPHLLNIINKALASIPAEEADDIFNRWVGEMQLGSPTVGVMLSLYSWEITAFILLLVLLGWLLQRAIVLRQRATASEVRKTQFLAIMSHEIRTPMNAMIASLELMKRTENAHQQNQYLALASSSARNLLDLLNDVLDHSKLSANGIVLESQPFNLNELVNVICDSYMPMVADKGLTLQVFVPESLTRQWVVGDEHRLRQIISNLLSNAIKFTHKGGIDIDLDTESETESTTIFSISVRDTGIGITPEAQRTLFDAWTQVDNSASRRYSGSGLGLWISQQLVILMGGELSVSSLPDEGSTFSVKLPLLRCETQSLKPEPLLPHFTSDTVILLVEDHPAAQRTMQEQLAALGCQVELAENGRRALALLEDENYYDVILLDVNLPDYSGYDIARKLRFLERQRGNEHMPVVAISAMSDAAHYAQCQANGFDAVLTKPIILNVLAKNLRRWCHLATPESAVTVIDAADTDELKSWLEADVRGFEHACRSKDVKEMIYYVHRLRGTAQIYHLDELAQTAETIESKLRTVTAVDEENTRLWLQDLKCAVTLAVHP